MTKKNPDLTATFAFARRERIAFLPLRTKSQGAGRAPRKEGWQARAVLRMAEGEGR